MDPTWKSTDFVPKRTNKKKWPSDPKLPVDLLVTILPLSSDSFRWIIMFWSLCKSIQVPKVVHGPVGLNEKVKLMRLMTFPPSIKQCRLRKRCSILSWKVLILVRPAQMLQGPDRRRNLCVCERWHLLWVLWHACFYPLCTLGLNPQIFSHSLRSMENEGVWLWVCNCMRFCRRCLSL